MVQVPRLLTLATHVLVGVTANAALATAGAPDPFEVQLKLEQVSWSPFVHQAVRLRLSVVNGSANRLGPVRLLDDTVQVLIKGPQDTEFKQVSGYVVRESGRSSVPTPRESIDSRAPLFLDPGERAYLSLAVAADWVTVRRQGQEEQLRLVSVPRPVFYRAGKHTVKVLVVLNAERGVRLEQAIDIEVRDPQGDDEAVLRILKKEELLYYTLMHPVDPPEKALIPKLQDLVERYPKSSYTDYARFALARGYRQGIGVHPPSDRVATAQSADQLQKVVERRWDSKVEKLEPSRFAYLPNVLILWKAVEPLAREDTLRRLDRAFPDSVEWLEEVAASLMSSESARRKDVEFVLDKKFPSPLTVPPSNTKAFISDAWKTYRKRVPKVEEAEVPRVP